ncbi:MAG: SDR family oxidoreductase [Deltaproteobacteria bacterium]|nr:SDR family oxidoreductase [Deltaproteobacteria bacterium]
MKKKQLLIAGGAGFIGSHFCDHFLQKGDCRVLCADNLITGQEKNIAHLYSNPDFCFLKQDVIESFDVPGEIDFVLNLASPASPVDYQRYPIETLKAGSFGTWNLLELSARKKAVFLLASTSEIYGDPQVHPQKEDYWGNVNSVGPRSCYDEAKRYAESLTLFYHQQYGVPVRIARIFNTYGPRMRLNDGRALPNFMTQALQNEDLTVFGKGLQTRSFCYVEDMVLGLERLLFSGETMPVNLGNPEEIPIIDFAQTVIRLTGSKSAITYRPLPKDDPMLRRPDISMAKELLGWVPKIGLEEGLKKTIPYFAENAKNVL